MGVQTIIALSTRGTNITAMVVTNASTTTIVMTIVAMLQRPRLIYVFFQCYSRSSNNDDCCGSFGCNYDICYDDTSASDKHDTQNRVITILRQQRGVVEVPVLMIGE